MHCAWDAIDDTSSNWFVEKNHCFSGELQVLFVNCLEGYLFDDSFS